MFVSLAILVHLYILYVMYTYMDVDVHVNVCDALLGEFIYFSEIAKVSVLC